ncbi:MAG: DUF2079 domain-containing protein [Actinobacteria bacterium]|nr:DUF2079 domain-containing protein [Actinomycetota bacterium]
MARRRPGLRRRLDHLALRVQGRVDAAWADRVVPWAMAAALFALLVAIALAVLRQLDGGPSLAVWGQAAWRVRHGQRAWSSVAGRDPVASTWAFAAWPLLWASRWVPTSALLSVVQALALSLAVVPIWRFAREVGRLRVGTTTLLCAAYALAPQVHVANLGAFHPEAIAVGAVSWATLFLRRRRWWAYWACVGLALASRGDVGFLVAGLGVLAAVQGQRRVGWATAGLGFAWSVAAVVALDPTLAGRTVAASVDGSALAPLAAARDLVTRPLDVLGAIADRRTLPELVALFGPLLFLPLTAPRHLAPAAGPVVLGIAGDAALRDAAGPTVAAGALGSAPLLLAVVPVVLAAAVALSRIGRKPLDRVNTDHRLAAALALATLALFVEAAPTSPYNQPWAWGGRDAADAAREEALDGLRRADSITVSPQMAAMVAEWPAVREGPAAPPPRPGTWRPGTDAVLLDTNGRDAMGLAIWDDADRTAVVVALRARGYRVVLSAEGIILLRR